MIAFHFPPAAMGSGHLRTLGFARYLPASGWNPVVLSAHASAYPRTAAILPGLIPTDCEVRRAVALDAGRHLAIAGKYPGFIATPDRWATWWLPAVWQGLRLIRRHRIDVIWSTYPIMTAHCIARTLSRIAKVPWIADFRDPVSGSVDTANRWAAASQRRWENRVLARADRVIFTTPGALRDYAQRYPDADSGCRLGMIENGYDEAVFADLPVPESHNTRRPLVLLHSGLLYQDGRDPLPFFSALAQLKAFGKVTAADIRVVLRASGSEAVYSRELERLVIGDLVTLAPPVSNREALVEQARADGLLLFQGSRFNRQIPAKLYEYLRIGRPVLAMVDVRGDTAATLGEVGGAELCAIDDADAIAARLLGFIENLRGNRIPSASPEVVSRYSRRAGAARLARVLDEIASQRASAPAGKPSGSSPARGNDIPSRYRNERYADDLSGMKK